MKKLASLLILLLATVALVSAQTMSVHLSGTVTADSTGVPVVNHEVLISGDSIGGFPFYASRHTNANGFYDCTIQNVPLAPASIFTVKTRDCNEIFIQHSFPSSSSPAVINFVICTQAASCEAAFTYYSDSANLLNYHFNSTSFTPAGSTITAYNWDFGDGSAHAFTKDPWHLYTAAGVYHVCLTIATSNGCTSIKCMEIHVIHTECVAKFEYQRDSSNLLRFHFFDSSTLPQGNTISSRSWDFGDGSPLATTSDPWHTYAAAGEFHVCLTIVSNTGCSSTWCDVVNPEVITHNCENWISFTKEMLSVSFEGHTQSTFPTTWLWNFGDAASPNNTSTLKLPQHTYTAQGPYTVILHSADSSGCENTSTLCIYVHGTVDIRGAVNAGNNFVDHGFIELIRIDSANVTTVVDTKEFGDSAGMYSFGGVYPGRYYLRAELLPASSYYGQFAPTYYKEALNWTGAIVIESGNPENPYNFGLRHISGALSGTGNIDGVVTQGTKVNSGGTAAANVEVLLLDGQNAVLAYTKTDAEGHFGFSNIAMGEYTVWPEVAGLPTIPAHITLSMAMPSVNLPFSLTGSQITYGIGETLPAYFDKAGEIFSNPVTNGSAAIIIEVRHELNLDLLIYNPSGQLVHQNPVKVHKGRNVVSFEAENLGKGSYFLQLRSTEGGSVVRKFTVNN